MKKGTLSLLSLLAGGAAAGAAVMSTTGKKLQEKVTHEHTMAEKHLMIMKVFDQWLKVKQQGKNLSKFFEERGYKTVAVYGMSFLGERLVDELKGTGVEVKYGIDKNADNIYSDVSIVKAEDELASVDAIVVTAVYFFDEIEELLSEKVECPVISLEDIVYEV